MSALMFILTYIQEHPDEVVLKPFQYANAIRFGISDQVDLPMPRNCSRYAATR